MVKLDIDWAQHISCFPHPIQFHWDTDSLVHIVLYKELDLVLHMSGDMLYHILCTLDPQWNILFLLMYQCVYIIHMYEERSNFLYIALLFGGGLGGPICNNKR